MSRRSEMAPEMASADGPTPAKHWRDYATSAEKLDLEGLEQNAVDLDARRERISWAIRKIRDRCIARRRYDDVRKNGPEIA